MPSTYFVEFKAFIDERRRPEGFPHEVVVQETYDNVENTQHLQMIVNKRFIELVTSAGLVVLKNPSETQALGVITFDKRRFVPWHMLTHLEMSVKHMPEVSEQTQDVLSPSDPTPEKKKEKVN